MVRIPWSHYCRKAEWGLTYAGIPYTTIDVGLRGMVDWMEVLPDSTVPVLRVGDQIVSGSDQILLWADYAGHAGLYPRGAGTWERWADADLGPATRREAYRCAYQRPGRYGTRRLVHVALRMMRPQILGVLKFYKARRFEDLDAEAVPAALRRIADGLRETGTGHLVGRSMTAADIAVAALVEPLLRIQDHPCRGSRDWKKVERFVERVRPERVRPERVRPERVLRTGRRRATARDLEAWRGLVED